MVALYPTEQHPVSTDDAETARTKLDAGFQSLLLRLAHLQTVMGQLKLTPRRDLAALLSCWSSIDTHGYYSLYRHMFLNPSILALDSVFQEDGYGNYLQDTTPQGTTPKVVAHTEALRAACNLTQEEFDLILQELGFDANMSLNLANVSTIFRHGYLARKLRLSVREFLALKAMSGLDPFLPLDLEQPPNPAQPLGAVRPPAIRFIELVQRIKDSPLKVSQLLYFLHMSISAARPRLLRRVCWPLPGRCAMTSCASTVNTSCRWILVGRSPRLRWRWSMAAKRRMSFSDY
jgi:hypothetical protein